MINKSAGSNNPSLSDITMTLHIWYTVSDWKRLDIPAQHHFVHPQYHMHYLTVRGQNSTSNSRASYHKLWTYEHSHETNIFRFSVCILWPMQSEVLSFSGLQTVVSDPIYPICMTKNGNIRQYLRRCVCPT